jgi:hypothetical protein
MYRLRVIINASCGAAAVRGFVACCVMLALQSLAQNRNAVCVCRPARCRRAVNTAWSHLWFLPLAPSGYRQSTSTLHFDATPSTDRVAALPLTYPCEHTSSEKRDSDAVGALCRAPVYRLRS